ncbi:MAG: hypothetical protein L0287_32885 [Anaerolineae bacterium]|nr:hypothetical protein [Anaerolineae bacterium]
MQRIAVQRFLALAVWSLNALLLGAKWMLDLLGYTTAPEDFKNLQKKLPAFLTWLFSSPWWVPSLLMVLLTLLVVWVCLPKREKDASQTAIPASSGRTPINDTSSQTQPTTQKEIHGKDGDFVPQAKKSFRNEEVKLANLHTDINPSLDGYIFDTCLIRGPAMLLLNRGQILGKTRILDTEGNLENILIEIPEERRKIGGVVQLNNCVFKDCTFRWVGIIGSKEQIDQIRNLFKK